MHVTGAPEYKYLEQVRRILNFFFDIHISRKGKEGFLSLGCFYSEALTYHSKTSYTNTPRTDAWRFGIQQDDNVYCEYTSLLQHPLPHTPTSYLYPSGILSRMASIPNAPSPGVCAFPFTTHPTRDPPTALRPTKDMFSPTALVY